MTLKLLLLLLLPLLYRHFLCLCLVRLFFCLSLAILWQMERAECASVSLCVSWMYVCNAENVYRLIKLYFYYLQTECASATHNSPLINIRNVPADQLHGIMKIKVNTKLDHIEQPMWNDGSIKFRNICSLVQTQQRAIRTDAHNESIAWIIFSLSHSCVRHTYGACIVYKTRVYIFVRMKARRHSKI